MANLYNRQRSKQELLRHVGHMDQVAGIKLLEALDGKARGSRVLEVWTGTGLRFRVLADRALDISACDYQGKSLSWLSPVGDAHPAYYEPPGAGWLRTFQGGFLVTCGLDQFGTPSTDEGVELGLHGRVSTLPARAVNYRTEWVDDEYELEISGEVRQAVLFGENLVLRRTISTRLGSNRIRIADTVVNEGFAPHTHMILYHFNLGFPLVSAASRIHVDVEKSTARDPHAEPGLAQWDSLQPPTAGYLEQVFLHVPVADPDGYVQVELRNPDLGLGLRWRYRRDSLPYLVEWKMMGEGAYVVGIEPANCNGLKGRAAARASGDLPILQPGESVEYILEVEAFAFAAG